MTKTSKELMKKLIALAVASAFLFEQVACLSAVPTAQAEACPMSAAKSLGVAMVEQGVAIGAAKTFDNPVIAAAVSSAVGGGLHGQSGRRT